MSKKIVLKMEPEDDGFPWSDRYHKLLFDLRVQEWQPFIEIAINAAIRWYNGNSVKDEVLAMIAVAPDGVVLIGEAWTVIVPWSTLREFVGAPPGSPKL